VRFDDRELEVEGTAAALRQLAALVQTPAELFESNASTISFSSLAR
jgi:hypothetical protein